jgi:hypothetical protein
VANFRFSDEHWSSSFRSDTASTALFALDGTRRQNLIVMGLIPVHCYPFDRQGKRPEKQLFDVIDAGSLGNVHRFRNRIVGMLLKSSLDPKVPFGCHIVRGLKDIFRQGLVLL